MDVEAPPPFSAGSLEEPPDPHDSVRLAVFEEDDNDLQTTHAQTDMPIPELEDFGKENGIPDLTNLDCVSKKNLEVNKHIDSEVLSRSPLPSSATETPDESEDEWGDFDSTPVASFQEQECSTQQIIEDDDVVNDFEEPKEEEAATTITEEKIDIEEDDDDEWGAFDSAPCTSQAVESTQDDDEWGAFGEPATVSAGVSVDDDDWAADFSSAPAPLAVEAVQAENIPSLEDLLESSDLWNSDEESEIVDDETLHLHELLDREDPTDLDPNHILLSSAILWKALRVVEEAQALKYQWKTACTNKKLLKELNIDPEAIGRGSLPPLTSSDVLKPTPVSNGSTKLTVLTLTPGENSARVSSASPSEAPTGDKTTVENSSSTFNSLMVPPADFDWDKSGLTNPLKGANRSSALLDVDFLSANSAGGGSADSALQKDLAELGLSTMAKNAPKSINQPSMLDAILSSAAAQQKKYRAPSELSLDALALHDQLSDIDYLRANMIMFPIGNNKTGNGH